MNQLLNTLQTNDFTLLVSLPRNDVRLAEAALRGGAQGLKVHLNVEHFASGTRFGTLEEERESLARIVEVAQAAGVSVGVVPGAGGAFTSEDEFAELAAMGIDFFDSYPFDAPPWTLSQRHLDVMLAAYAGDYLDTMMFLEDSGMTMCEASIMPHEEYGRELSALDIARYRQLAQTLEAPVIVPSQKKVAPRDVAALQGAGVKALLIGAIVTGREPESIEIATRAFRHELV